MLDLVRTSLHKAITTPLGDGFLPIRVQKDIARRMNMLLGEPICSRAELERRREGRARLEELKTSGGTTTSAPLPAIQAPVTVYFERDRNARMFGRMKEMLDAKEIAYKVIDVADDASARAFVLREAKCKDDDLPIVFVASSAVGGYNELVDWDISGKLGKALKGE